MSYTDVFGGNLIFPSRVSYNSITTSVDVVLQWPTEQQIEGVNVVADVMDVNTTAGGLNIDMPDARNTSTGNKATFNNVGGVNTFTVRDATGGSIQAVAPGEAWVLVLTDNSTEAGTWSTFQLGGNAATQASASALAGAGLRANINMLDQMIDSDVEAATPFTVVDGDRAKCLIYTAGAGTCNLPTPGAVGNNWFFMLRNSGSGTLNIVPPSGNIDGASSLNLDPDSSTFIFTDGTDFYTIGLTAASTVAFDFVSIAVPGSGDFTLSGANLNRISYRFTGALTGNRRIIVPNTTQQYWVDNQTTGAFTLEITTSAGSGQTIPQGESAITYCDATDVINAVSSTSVTFPITIGQGGTSATNATDARTNLSAAFEGILINTLALSGLTGGGDLTADRDLELDTDNLTTENTVDSAADTVAFYDDDAGAMRKTIIDNIAPGLTFPLDLADNDQIRFGTGQDFIMEFDGTDMLMDAVAGDILIQVASSTVLQVDAANTRLVSEYPLYIAEASAAGADITNYGQLWVFQDPFTTSLMYTNDNGNDFEIAALNLTDMNTSIILITGTSFVECLVCQPDINRDYMVNIAFEVTAPAADDMNVQMVIDTNAVFKGVLTYSNQAAGISGTFALESGIGDVITNIVTVPTDGSATPDGTYVTIVGCLNMGATSGTHSVRCAKNADTGADGRMEATAALQLTTLQVS